MGFIHGAYKINRIIKPDVVCDAKKAKKHIRKQNSKYRWRVLGFWVGTAIEMLLYTALFAVSVFAFVVFAHRALTASTFTWYSFLDGLVSVYGSIMAIAAVVGTVQSIKTMRQPKHNGYNDNALYYILMSNCQLVEAKGFCNDYGAVVFLTLENEKHEVLCLDYLVPGALIPKTDIENIVIDLGENAAYIPYDWIKGRCVDEGEEEISENEGE